MTEERKINEEREPTIRDVIEIMGTRFLITDKRLIALNSRVDSIDARLGTIERDLLKTKGTMLDVQDDVTTALAEIDRHHIRYPARIL